MVLKLKEQFARIGNDFVTELKQAILKQKDLLGQSFSPIAKSTAWNRFYLRRGMRREKHLAKGKSFSDFKAKKGKNAEGYPAGVALNRLLVTKDFAQNAYASKAQDQSVTIFVSEGNHRDPGTRSQISYADIVRYNNRGSDEINTNIKNPPLIFPNNPDEVRKMNAWKLLQEVHAQNIAKEIVRQVRAQVQARRVEIQL